MKKFSQQAFTKIPRALRWFTFAAIALLACGAQAQSPVFTNVWVLPAGYHPDLTNRADAGATTSRGVGISPLTTNVLFSSTYGNTNGGSAHVATLGFDSGSNYLAQLNGTGVSGGVVTLMNVRVTDDGSVYACNRRDGGVNTFTIYRWPSETDVVTAPVKVVDAAFTQRLGDHMDVRGSGIDTEIVVVGSLASGAAVSTNFFIFRPTDAALTNFTNFSITIPGNTASSIVSAHGVTFEGTNNAIYVSAGTAIRRVSYDPVTLTATVTRTNATDSANCRGLKYYSSTNGIGLLASVQYNTTAGSAQLARVFQIPASPTAALVSVLSSNFPAPFTGSQNGNGLGQVDAKNGYFVFGAPGYGLTFFKVNFIDTVPPTVGTISGGGTYVEGYPVTLSSIVSGSAPLTYRWFYNTNTLIVGAITNSYSIPSVQISNAGRYSLVVTNLYGVSTSSYAGLTVLPGGYSGFASNLWTLAPGSRPYITTGDTQRGLAYDPIYNRLVLVSRSPTNAVHILDANDGADLGELDMALILSNPTPPGGSFVFNMCGVAEDGAVYVGNLLTSTNTDEFTIYRWDGATNSVLVGQAFAPNNPAIARLGDTMAVRGAGANTEILCSFRTWTNLALFLPNDGLGQTYSLNILTVTNLPEDAVTNGFAGLGLAFGPGNTFWAKSSGFSLRQVSYDTNTLTAQVIATYTNLPISEAPLGVDNVNGFVATVAFGQNPQNLSIWDVSGGEPNAVQLDREVFGSNNANANGTGAVAVDVAGGRIFALDSNNGLIAVAYPPKLFIARETLGGIVTWTGPGALQSSTNLTGPYSDVLGATSPHTNTAAGQIFFRVVR